MHVQPESACALVVMQSANVSTHTLHAIGPRTYIYSHRIHRRIDSSATEILSYDLPEVLAKSVVQQKVGCGN